MRRVLLVPVALLLGACGARTGLEHAEAPLVVDHSLRGLSLGVKHTCVWFHDGTARCWGWNGQGQLGDGTRERRAIPTKVLELSDAVRIDLGAQHSCALESRGEVQCWGDRSNGQVGEGSPLTDFTVPSAITKPVDVVGLGRGSGVAQLALGEAHSCARYDSGDARALPYPDGAFDVVCAMDFLEHIDDPAQVVAEASRVLAPGGLFFFHTFNRNRLAWLVVIKGVEWFVKNTPRDLHVLRLFVKPEELEAMCVASGLTVRALRGSAPRVFSTAFFGMLATGVVPPDFRFEFTSSTRIGYTGFAEKAARTADAGAT